MWDVLRPWSAWRGVESGLGELAGLLRRAGAGRGESPVLDLADQVEAVLTEPLAAHEMLPGAYRVRLGASRAGRAELEEGDLESQLGEWLTELTRHLADVPALLEAPDSGAQLGHLLTSELPKTWQARFGGLAQGFRSLGRGGVASVERAPVVDGGVRLLGRYLQTAPDGYQALLPAEAGSAELSTLHTELCLALLRDLGPDVLRLHLLLLAADGPVEREQAWEGLGLHRRGIDLREANRRCHAALERLRGVRITLLRWWADEAGTAGWERSQEELWQVRVSEFGQGYLAEQGDRLVARGLGWSAEPDPRRSWALLSAPPDLAQFAQTLLCDLEGNRNLLSLATALLLRSGDPISHREVFALAGLDPAADPTAAWRSLRAAFRLQARAGRHPDFSAWPTMAAAAQDMPSWLDAATTFGSQS